MKDNSPYSWNLDKNLKILDYTFKEDLYIDGVNKLIANLFQSEDVTQALNCPSFLELRNTHPDAMTIDIEEVPCTILSMNFFDRIYDSGIVLADGSIRKCIEDYVEDIPVADELRNLLLVEDSENYGLFGEEERKEFLFRIFKHLCIGGVLNQYEDNINAYLMMTKMLYKDIVCVRKTGELKKISVISKIFEVICKINDKPVLPSTCLHPQDFLYVILNSNLKKITILTHTW